MQKLGLTLKIMGWLFHIETPQPPPADRSAIEQAFTRTIEDQIIEDPAVLTQNKDFIDLSDNNILPLFYYLPLCKEKSSTNFEIAIGKVSIRKEMHHLELGSSSSRLGLVRY